MAKYSLLLSLCFFLTYHQTLGHSPVSVEQLTILNAEREIDISSQLVQITSKLKLENTNSPGSVKYFLFTVDPQHKARLSFLGATSGKSQLRTSVVQLPTKSEALTYKIELSSELAKGKSVDVEVEVIYTKYLEPFPSEISQKEKQLVKYTGSHYLYAPYKTNKQITRFLLASKNVESFTKLKPSSHSDNMVTFGPYENIEPFTVSECVIHYENNSPFLAVSKLERVIEISHWGNIAVEEHIEIVHTGAKLKGSFSRFEYQREQNSGISSIKAFKTLLPAAARDVYYRDDIGNISTSNMNAKLDSVELNLRPRFPLFGGWKTRYVVGYNVPSYEYLYVSGNQYKLKMRLLDHIYDTMIVEDLVLKIILPEGTTDIEIKTPFALKELPRSLHYTYLDISGRPVITLVGNNLVENHIQDFTIDYNFPKIYMLQEPLVVIVAFMILFASVLIWVRLDFSLNPGKSSKTSGANSANSAIVETVLRRHGKRAAIYENFDSHISKLKTSKDSQAFQTTLRTMTAEHKTETTSINEIMTQNKAENPTLAENLLELQRLDRGFWEVYIQYSQSVEKLVAGKMSRSLFMDQDNTFMKKRDELADKMNTIIKNI